MMHETGIRNEHMRYMKKRHKLVNEINPKLIGMRYLYGLGFLQ